MLVGRDEEVGRLGAILDGARHGAAGALVIRGEPGIGKTSLLEWAVAHRDGLRLLRTAGVESEAELAWSGLHGLLRPLLGQLHVLPEPQAAALRAAFAIDGGAVADRFTVYLATLGLLAGCAEETPLLCVVDDAHWLDTASADALTFTARRLAADPVAMVFAVRTGERVLQTDGLPELAIGGLDDRASTELIDAAGRVLSTEAVASLRGLAAGNPLALVELPRTLTDEQAVGRAPVDGSISVTDAIERTFLRRLPELSDAGRRALLLAATGGDAVLRCAAADPTVDAGLAEAYKSGLLRRDGRAVQFRHPLVRAVVDQAASATDRRAAHATIAAVLTEPGDGDERVWHLADASSSADEDIALALEGVAARAAQRGALAAAARAHERAARLTADVALRARRLVVAADVALLAGEVGTVTGLLDEADGLTTDACLRADILLAHCASGRAAAWPGVYEALLAGAENVAPHDAPRAARLLSEASVLTTEPGGLHEPRALDGRAWDLLGRRVSRGTEAVAIQHALNLLLQFELEQAVAIVLEVLSVASTSADIDALEARAFAADQLIFSESPEARAAVTAIVDATRDSASVPARYFALLTSTELDRREGRLRESHAAAIEALSMAEALGSWRLTWALARVAHVEAYLGLDAACRAHVESTNASLDAPDDWQLAGSHRSLGILALGAMDYDVAARELERAMELLASVAYPAIMDFHTEHVEALARAGRRTEALPALEALEERIEGRPMPRTLAGARRCRVLLADGDEAAAAAFAQAIDLGSGFDQARTRLMYGERLRRSGLRVDARAQLEPALATFDELGARGWAEHAVRELRASGATLRRRGEGASEALTPQELQVATLVAEGRSNREVGTALFISHKTVELHLSRVYRKLGVRSRTELARLQATEPARLTAEAVAEG